MTQGEKKSTEDEKKRLIAVYVRYREGEDAYQRGNGLLAVTILRPIADHHENVFSYSAGRLLMKLYRTGADGVKKDPQQYKYWLKKTYWNSPYSQLFGIRDHVFGFFRWGDEFFSKQIAEEALQEAHHKKPSE